MMSITAFHPPPQTNPVHIRTSPTQKEIRPLAHKAFLK